jgi:hypothetical protein
VAAGRLDDPPFADAARLALVEALLARARLRRERLLQDHLEPTDGARDFVRRLGRHRSANCRQTTSVPRLLCAEIGTAMPKT